MATADSILTDALSLPLPERQRIIQRLIESLDDQEEDDPAQDALADVISRRLADLDAGRAKVIDGKAAIAEARRNLAQRGRG
jgi:putative addiction module component (TIGR02574 family)